MKFRIWLVLALLTAGCAAQPAAPSPTAPAASTPSLTAAAVTRTPAAVPQTTPTIPTTTEESQPLGFVLVFSQFNRILSLVSAGHLAQLVENPDLDLEITLSPDGQWLAYQQRSERRALWLVGTAEGSQPVRYSLEEIIPLGSRMLLPAWTADSRELRFAYGVAGPVNRLLGFGALERASGKTRTLLDLKSRDVSGAVSYSPDGKFAALASMSRVHLADLESGLLTRDLLLFEPFSRSSDRSTWLPAPQWNLDSTAFWVAVPDPTSTWEQVNFRLFKVNIVGKIEDLPPLPGTYRGSEPPRVYFPPEGGQVLYTAADGLRWHMLRGGMPEVIFGWQAQVLGFAPDASWCLAQRLNGGLVLLNWRGEAREVNLPAGSISSAVWLDGQTLAYALHAPDGAWELYRQPVEGEPQLLVSSHQDARMKLFQGDFEIRKLGE